MFPIKRKILLFWIHLSNRWKWGVFLIGVLTSYQLYIYFTRFSTSGNFAPIFVNKFFHKIPSFNTISNEDSGKICEVPKLTPGNEEIYDLDYQQFQSFPYNGTLPPCALNQSTNTTNTPITPTMFAIDFESNLEPLNKEHFFWNDAKCFYKFQLKNLTETLYVENNSMEYEERVETITSDKTKLNETTEHIYVWCESTKNRDTIYEDILSQVPILPIAEERLKDLPANSNPDNYPSVLIFGQDSLSHMNFRRYMPKVHDFLVDKLEAIEFNGFVSLGFGTRLSIVPFFCGKSYWDVIDLFHQPNLTDSPKPQFIWNEYGKLGYRTSYAEDCATGPIFFFKQIPALEIQPVDYDFRQVSRNLEYISLKRHNKTEMGGCYGPRWTYDVVLENLYRTAYTFARRNKPFFHFTWTSELTHDVNYYSKFGEEYLLKTIENLHSNQLLNNTILILLGDHGMRHGQLRQETRQGYLEERLPLLYIALPKNFKERYPSAYKNMLGNTEKLITAFDLHATMKDIPNLEETETIFSKLGESKERSVSLFRQISNQRKCVDVGIPPEYCPCTDRITISLENQLVKIAAEQAINDTNQKLADYPQCHQLQLQNLTKAYRLGSVLLNDAKKNEEFNLKNVSHLITSLELMHEIEFNTRPGGGAFYALVVPHSYSIKVIEIERISAYGKDGHCVNATGLKPFCHCKV